MLNGNVMPSLKYRGSLVNTTSICNEAVNHRISVGWENSGLLTNTKYLQQSEYHLRNSRFRLTQNNTTDYKQNFQENCNNYITFNVHYDINTTKYKLPQQDVSKAHFCLVIIIIFNDGEQYFSRKYRLHKTCVFLCGFKAKAHS